MFCKRDVLNNFKKFSGKKLMLEPLFNQVEGLRDSNCIERTFLGEF